jgi:hypothetical protein
MALAGAVIVQYREARRYTPARRATNPSLLYVCAAAVFAFLALLAAALHVQNRSRLAVYQADGLCRAPLATPVTRDGSVCSVEYAHVVNRWVTWHRSTGYFHLGLRTGDGVIDSVELKGTSRQAMWEMSPMGASLLVQRFRESPRQRWHVTGVRTLRSVARTEWNPSWHADDTMAGVVFMSAGALIALIALVRQRTRAPRQLAR